MATVDKRRRDLEVSSTEFDRDPAKYIRQAGVDRKVLVHDAATGRLCAAFGGSLDVSPEIVIPHSAMRST